MKIEEFQLERTESLWENTVDYNLTETGIHPFTLEELLDEEGIEKLRSDNCFNAQIFRQHYWRVVCPN